jgi:MFS family permease
MTRLRVATDETFRSLRSRNFRLFFVGQLVSQAGTWMEMIAVTWVVLQLTDSGVALGLVAAARFAPVLLLGPWGGVLSDRLDRHRLMLVTQACFAALSTVLAVLVATGHTTLWLLYGSTLIFGVLTAMDSPSRRALVTELVEPEDIANAVGLNSALMTGARTIGPTIAGVMLAGPGASWCFAVNALSYLVIIGNLLRMDRSLFHTGPILVKAKGQMREGFVYVWRNQELLLPLILAAVIGTLAFNYQVTLPLFAERTLDGNAATFTWLYATMSFGSVCGALTVARRRDLSVSFLVTAGFAMTVATVALALAPNTPIALIAAVPLGFTSLMLISGTNAVVQLKADPAMRGRVLALVSMVFMGSTPIGGPIVGWISQQWDARAGLMVGAVATALATVWTARRLRRQQPADEPVPDLVDEPVPADEAVAAATAAA